MADLAYIKLTVDDGVPVDMQIEVTASDFASQIADAVEQNKVVVINYGIVTHQSFLVINCSQVRTVDVTPDR